MKNSVTKFLKFVFMAPFIFLFMNGAGDAGAIDQEAIDRENAERDAAKDAALQAAIDRGDIIVDDKDDLDPELLQQIMDEEGVELDDETATEADDKRSKIISRDRFDKLNEREKKTAEENERLKKELEELKAKPTKSAEELAAEKQAAEEAERENPTTIEGMEDKALRLQIEADKLMIEEGPDSEERLALIKQIHKINKDIAKLELSGELTSRTDAEKAAEAEAKEWSETLGAVHDVYPFLAKDHPKVNPAINENINTVLGALVKSGTPRVEALKKAVDMFAPDYAKANGFTDADPKKMEEAKKIREAAALKTAANASVRQPAPPPKKADKELGEINIDNLTQKQYDALPETVKAKMRGDTL